MGAHSKAVLRLHGMEESGVQFPVGPQIKLNKAKILAKIRACSIVVVHRIRIAETRIRFPPGPQFVLLVLWKTTPASWGCF